MAKTRRSRPSVYRLHKRWSARTRIGSYFVHLGTFETREAAVATYKRARKFLEDPRAVNVDIKADDPAWRARFREFLAETGEE
jgi:hypothetical protein